jgi:hypothetical protein
VPSRWGGQERARPGRSRRPVPPSSVWAAVGQHRARPRVGGKEQEGWQSVRARDGGALRCSRERSLAAADERHTDRHFSVAAFLRVCAAERGRCGVEDGTDRREQVRLAGVRLADERAQLTGCERDLSCAPEAAHLDSGNAEPCRCGGGSDVDARRLIAPSAGIHADAPRAGHGSAARRAVKRAWAEIARPARACRGPLRSSCVGALLRCCCARSAETTPWAASAS